MGDAVADAHLDLAVAQFQQALRVGKDHVCPLVGGGAAGKADGQDLGAEDFLGGTIILRPGILLAGIAMLVLPGQGLLTILIGLTLLNFPGKYTAERRLAGRPRIARTLNRIRAAARRPPLAIPGHQSD